MKTTFHRTTLYAAVMGASLTGLGSPVLAQAPAHEEVIVTATRRDASVQDVP